MDYRLHMIDIIVCWTLENVVINHDNVCMTTIERVVSHDYQKSVPVCGVNKDGCSHINAIVGYDGYSWHY